MFFYLNVQICFSFPKLVRILSSRCIGATTLAEYRQYMEKDKALERRFQQVFVGQPTVEDTVAIMRGLKDRYEGTLSPP